MFDWLKTIIQILCVIGIFISLPLLFSHHKKKMLVSLVGILILILLFFDAESIAIKQELKVYDTIFSADSILIRKGSGNLKEVSLSSYYDNQKDQCSIYYNEISFLPDQLDYQKIGTISFYKNESSVKTIGIIKLLDYMEQGQTRRFYLVGNDYYAFIDESNSTSKYLYSFPVSFSESVVQELNHL